MPRGVCVQVSFLVSCVWRGLSAFRLGCGDGSTDKGLHRRTVGLRLVRFDPAKPARPDNLVLLTDDEAIELSQLGPNAWGEKHPHVSRHVQNTLSRVHAVFGEL
jgi:hypothetical protein